MKYIIYKIQIKDFVYIGSTQNYTQRKAKHRRICINDYEQRHTCLLYKTIRENGGWDCCYMTPIKEIEVETRRQAEMVEESTRIEYDAQLNMRRPFTTDEEKKDYHKDYHKAYYESNREKINEYRRKWREEKKHLES